LYIERGSDGFDIASLRQGDILEGVPFPLLESAKMHVLADISQTESFSTIPVLSPRLHELRGDNEWTTTVSPVRFGFCTVLSNCCDLEPRQGGKVRTHAVVLARLRPIPPDIRRSQELFDSLVANRDPRDPTRPGFIEYFYLAPHRLLQELDWRVEFNQVVSVPTNDVTILLRKKILQLDDRTRMKFKIKLGFTYLRVNQDEIDAGLENPWQDAAPATNEGI
jgi:hypothetical protein